MPDREGPRLPYIELDDVPREHRWVYDDLLAARGFVPNVYRALANTPALMSDFVRMTQTLLAPSALPQDLKELAIVAVGHATGAETIVVAHSGFARNAGVPEAWLEAVPSWRDTSVFGERERAVLAYTEAATRDIRVDDATWDGARSHLEEEAMAELVLAVAFYNMVARFLVPAQVELDARYPR